MVDIKIALVVDSFYQANEMFNEFNLAVNRDDCQRPWIELRIELALAGINLSTIDLVSVKDANIVMFINLPSHDDKHFQEALSEKKTLFCVITELDLIHRNNGRHDLMALFDRVFTYQSDLVDNIKIFKTNYSFDFEKKFRELSFIEASKRDKNFTLIAGNKSLNHDNELYSKRIEVIKWFEANSPKDFDLYGTGWNRLVILRRYPLYYKSLGYFREFLPNNFKSYKGRIEKKDEVLKRYKFSFCFENAMNVKGWITEKIFDSLFNGCVPIYLGASEIDTVIPESCFIDMRKFNSYEEVNRVLSQMSNGTYNNYLTNIRNFIEDKSKDKSFEFSIPYFVKTIKNEVLKTINND